MRCVMSRHTARWSSPALLQLRAQGRGVVACMVGKQAGMETGIDAERRARAHAGRGGVHAAANRAEDPPASPASTQPERPRSSCADDQRSPAGEVRQVERLAHHHAHAPARARQPPPARHHAAHAAVVERQHHGVSAGRWQGSRRMAAAWVWGRQRRRKGRQGRHSLLPGAQPLRLQQLRSGCPAMRPRGRRAQRTCRCGAARRTQACPRPSAAGPGCRCS